MHQTKSKISPQTTAALKSNNTLLKWLQMIAWPKDLYILQNAKHMISAESVSEKRNR